MPNVSDHAHEVGFSSVALWLAAAICLSGAGTAAGQEDAEFRRVRVDHPRFIITVGLGSVATYGEIPIFEVYFPSDEVTGHTVLVPRAPDASGMTGPGEERDVFLLEPLVDNPATAIVLESCALVEGTVEDCADVQIATRIPEQRSLLEIRLQQPVDWNDSILRMTMPAGILRLDSSDAETGAPNPAIRTVLPVLSAWDLEYVEARPVLRFEVSPLARDDAKESDQGRQAVGLDFDGGLFRGRGEQRYGLEWSGHLATNDDLGFDQLRLDLEYERNLWPGSFLPVVIAVTNEADQDLDVIDTSATLELRFQLPLSVNGSPYHDFVPAVGPKIRLMGALGSRVKGAAETAAAEAGDGTDPTMEIDRDVARSFRRLGYEVHWRIPLSANTILRLHHAGLRNWSDFPRADEFHSLWDILLQTQVGELTYFVGLQEGSAAPLFEATETIRAGLVVSFR